MNEVANIGMCMSKQLVSYFAKIISEIFEVKYDKLFVKTFKFWHPIKLGVDAHSYIIY